MENRPRRGSESKRSLSQVAQRPVIVHAIHSLSSALVGLSPVVIGWSLQCLGVRMGSRLTNTRGCVLLEFIGRLNEDVANVSGENSYSRNGAESIIDVT